MQTMAEQDEVAKIRAPSTETEEIHDSDPCECALHRRF